MIAWQFMGSECALAGASAQSLGELAASAATQAQAAARSFGRARKWSARVASRGRGLAITQRALANASAQWRSLLGGGGAFDCRVVGRDGARSQTRARGFVGARLAQHYMGKNFWPLSIATKQATPAKTYKKQ